MSRGLVLGLDIGTASSKAVLATPAGLEPDPVSHARYSERYALSRELYPRTRGISHALGAIARDHLLPPAGGAQGPDAVQPVSSEQRTGRR